jgi:Tfp pilus assembly protein PilO
VTPKSIYKKDFYKVCDYEIKFTGTFHEFGEFLASVANFPFITNVSQINMVGLDAKNSKQNKLSKFDILTLEATFLMSTYFAKEDQKLAEANQ